MRQNFLLCGLFFLASVGVSFSQSASADTSRPATTMTAAPVSQAASSTVIDSSQKSNTPTAAISLQPTDSGAEGVTPPAAQSSTVAAQPPSQIEIPAGILYGKFLKENGSLLILGSIVVPAGEVLEFGPGVTVNMGGKYSTITVFGQLIAKGTAGQPVIFQSANAKPNPWDWDRIYLRSPTRSIFEHCVIRHANYGIMVENGSAAISNCVFEKNSLYGLVVKNGEAILRNDTLRRGHVCALLFGGGARVTAESLWVDRNITGIAAENGVDISIFGGSITRNSTGIAVRAQSAVALVGIDVSDNMVGVLSVRPVDKKTTEMIYGNSSDVKIVSDAQMNQMLKPPQEIKSLVLFPAKPVSPDKLKVTPSFSALKAPAEPTSSFLGTVTGGGRYFSPVSVAHPIDGTVRVQTRYLGEQSAAAYAGIQPELSLFASWRQNGADINLLADFYGNEWVSVRKNMFNLSVNYNDHSLVFGDFFENASETSISGRKMVGLRYVGNFLDMGKGEKRIEFKLAAGETEVPKEVGDHELDIYNNDVDSGMAVRQQITYATGVLVRPTFNSSVAVRAFISRDQMDVPLFRNVIKDPGMAHPVEGQTGCIEGKLNLLNNTLALSAEIDMGVHDTIRDTASIVWYNPNIPRCADTVFRVIPTMRNYAIALNANGTAFEMAHTLSYTEIAPEYFSAGNPYLEADRRKITYGLEKTFSDNAAGTFGYAFERRNLSRVFDAQQGIASPVDNHMTNLSGQYSLSEYLPSFSLDYTLSIDRNDDAGDRVDSTSNPGTVDTITQNILVLSMKNMAGFEVKHKFENGIDYSVKYQILHDNDMTAYIDPVDVDQGDGISHRFTGKLSFKIGKIIHNKFSSTVALKNTVLNALNGVSYKISDQLRVDIIPRKLRLSLQGEYSNKLDEKFDSDLGRRNAIATRFSNFVGEIKYSITPKISLNLLGKYEVSYDELTESTDNYSLKTGALNMTYLF